MWSEIFTGGASTAFSAYNASKAEAAQRKANEDAMAFNAREAEKQRMWEQNMYSSRYQLARKDLEAAGYNPLLALGGQPTVSGAAAHAELKSEWDTASGVVERAGTSAAQVARSMAEIATVRAQANLTRQESEHVKQQTRIARIEADQLSTPAGQVMRWVQRAMQSGGSQVVNAVGGAVVAKRVWQALQNERYRSRW